MEFSLVKKLEIKKIKTTFIISVLKVVYWVALVFSKSNFLLIKLPGKEIECEIKYFLAVIQLYRKNLKFLQPFTHLKHQQIN